MRVSRWVPLVNFACALLVGCQTAGPVEPVQLSVVVHSGFAVPTTPLGDLSAPVAVLVDARGNDGDLSLRRAAAFLEALPAPSPVRAHVVGHEKGEACDGGDSLRALDRAELAARFAALDSSGAGSLAAALELAVAETGGDVERLVVFSSRPEDSCADVCVAAERLADAGVWQDWVVPPDVDVPSCLAELRPRIEGPGFLAEELKLAAPGFQVYRSDDLTGRVLAAGQSGDAVSVPPGDVTLQLDLSPEERVGPLRLRPGESIRVLVLEFPMTEPPMRSWWVERESRGGRP